MTATSPKIDTNVLNTSTLENSNNASVASMSAGGSSANYFDVLEAWYPVHYVRDLDRLAPTKFTLLGYLEQSGGSSNYTKAFYLPTAADAFVTQLRQWVNEYKVEFFPGQTLAPSNKTREQFMERYHSHTVHCGSCSKALANIKKIRTAIGFIGTISWALIPVLNQFTSTTAATSITSLTFLVISFTWYRLGKLEQQFYQGRLIPPRNLPEKPKK